MSHFPQGKSLGLALIISLLLHVGLFALLLYLPGGEAKKQAKDEPIMVDLQDLPQLDQQISRDTRESKRKSDAYRRVPQEIAPLGDLEREKPAHTVSAEVVSAEVMKLKPLLPRFPAKPSEMKQPVEPQESLFRPQEQLPSDIARLYPSPGKLAMIEESYRKKYSPEVKESDTKFLNTDDMMFGSFLRRFETAVYGVWRYPAEAARLGIEGVTPVRITFKRNGAIEKIELLESSGSRILDEEVRRTLGLIGPVGAFPRAYDKETFHLVAFFHYGIVSGSIRGRLY
jgi:protein TonB